MMASLDLGSLSHLGSRWPANTLNVKLRSLSLSFPAGVSEERSSKNWGVTSGLT